MEKNIAKLGQFTVPIRRLQLDLFAAAFCHFKLKQLAWEYLSEITFGKLPLNTSFP